MNIVAMLPWILAAVVLLQLIWLTVLTGLWLETSARVKGNERTLLRIRREQSHPLITTMPGIPLPTDPTPPPTKPIRSGRHAGPAR